MNFCNGWKSDGTRKEVTEVTTLPSRNDGSYYYWPIKKYKSGNRYSEETCIVAFASYCEAIKSNIVE